MRIFALFVLAVGSDALHAAHQTASVHRRPAIRARAQRHLHPALAIPSSGDVPGSALSAAQVERTRGTWLEQARPTLAKTLKAFFSITLPVNIAAGIATAKVPAPDLLVITQNLRDAARVTAPLLLLLAPLSAVIGSIVNPIAGACFFALSQLVMSVMTLGVPNIMRTPGDVLCSLLYGNPMHLDQAAREALLQSHALGVAYGKLCGFIALKLNTFIKAWSGVMMAFAPWYDITVTFVVVGPFVEEVVFRHFVQRGFQRMINRTILGRCSKASSDEQADKAASRRGAATTTTHFLVSLAFALYDVLGPIGDVMVGGQSRLPPVILRQFVYAGLASFLVLPSLHPARAACVRRRSQLLECTRCCLSGTRSNCLRTTSFQTVDEIRRSKHVSGCSLHLTLHPTPARALTRATRRGPRGPARAPDRAPANGRAPRVLPRAAAFPSDGLSD